MFRLRTRPAVWSFDKFIDLINVTRHKVVRPKEMVEHVHCKQNTKQQKIGKLTEPNSGWVSDKRESNQQNYWTHGDRVLTLGGACASHGNPDVRNDLVELAIDLVKNDQ